jgi:MSHA biogenesis protein MshQ
VTLSSGDTVTANRAITISANNGFDFTAVTVGSAAHPITLESRFSPVTITGPSAIYGDINTKGTVTISNTSVAGAIHTNGNITLTGGSVSGLVTSTGNTLSASNTNLMGGATANSGMSISGGTLKGDFELSAGNLATFTGVTMDSGSITGADIIKIDNSTLGSGAESITITSSSNQIEVKDSTVYGTLTAPNYSEVRVDNSNVYGECLPQSNPPNACQEQASFVGYKLDYAAEGITCKASAVTVTAVDTDGNAVNPPDDTTVTLTSSGGNASWNSSSYTFNGSTAAFTAYLSNTLAASVGFTASDGSISASGAINFKASGLLIEADGGGNVLPGFAGSDMAAQLRAVKTNDETGACEARVQGNQWVNFAYHCINPSSCIAGQSFQVNATNTANPVAVNFDAAGVAPLTLQYSDVGQLTLEAALTLDSQGEDPAITLTGASNPFVVKPHTLVVSRVTRADGSANPKTRATGQGFVAAGEAFTVVLEARNSAGSVTPNYGNEAPPQTPRLASPTLLVEYPSGGQADSLNHAAAFTPVAGNTGRFINEQLSWPEVGTFTVIPKLQGDDYLAAGDMQATTRSEDIGRFYPHDYVITSTHSENACTSGALPFSYMSQPAIELTLAMTARNLAGATVNNYDDTLGYKDTAVPDASSLVAENDNDGAASQYTVQATLAGNWQNGEGIFTAVDAAVLRRTPLNSASWTPWPHLQIGISGVTDKDNRALAGAFDMNANTDTDCHAAANCNAVAIGGELELRYGRLYLGSAYGPEALDLPVKVTTQYYNGSRWQRNDDDSCTRIARDNVTYPNGAIRVDANRDVTLGAGVARGEYPAGGIDADDLIFSQGQLEHYFSAPGAGNTGSFEVDIDMSSDDSWLTFDWDGDGDLDEEITGQYQFGSYRGHDRILYWREVLQ